MGANPIGLGPLQKGEMWTHMDMQGRTSRDDEGKDWGASRTCQGPSEITSTSTKDGGEAHHRFSFTVPRETQLCRLLIWISSFQNCVTINFYCLCCPVRGAFLWQPLKTNTEYKN